MTYRVFSNDRGKVRGVPMYSCLMEVRAFTPELAIAQCNPDFGTQGGFAPMKALEWPVSTQASKDWLAKHV